jgi:hypothetical protein
MAKRTKRDTNPAPVKVDELPKALVDHVAAWLEFQDLAAMRAVCLSWKSTRARWPRVCDQDLELVAQYAHVDTVTNLFCQVKTESQAKLVSSLALSKLQSLELRLLHMPTALNVGELTSLTLEMSLSMLAGRTPAGHVTLPSFPGLLRVDTLQLTYFEDAWFRSFDTTTAVTKFYSLAQELCNSCPNAVNVTMRSMLGVTSTAHYTAHQTCADAQRAKDAALNELKGRKLERLSLCCGALDPPLPMLQCRALDLVVAHSNLSPVDILSVVTCSDLTLTVMSQLVRLPRGLKSLTVKQRGVAIAVFHLNLDPCFFELCASSLEHVDLRACAFDSGALSTSTFNWRLQSLSIGMYSAFSAASIWAACLKLDVERLRIESSFLPSLFLANLNFSLLQTTRVRCLEFKNTQIDLDESYQELFLEQTWVQGLGEIALALSSIVYIGAWNTRYVIWSAS